MNLWSRLRHSDHEKIREFLSPYLDGEVSEDEQALVERHLRDCSSCRDALESLRWTAGLLAQMPEEPLPRRFILRRTDVETARPAPRFRWAYPLLRGATAVAGLLLVVLLTLDWSLGMGAMPAPAPQIEAVPTNSVAVQKTPPRPASPAAPTKIALAPAAEPVSTRTPPELAPAPRDTLTKRVTETVRVMGAETPPPVATKPEEHRASTQAVHPTQTEKPSASPAASVPAPPPHSFPWRSIEIALGFLFVALAVATWRTTSP